MVRSPAAVSRWNGFLNRAHFSLAISAHGCVATFEATGGRPAPPTVAYFRISLRWYSTETPLEIFLHKVDIGCSFR